MKIFVCVKHVPDSAATITVIEKNQIDEQVTFLLNPYDENAITAAVKLKNQFKGTEIIAVSVGKSDAFETIQSALAMGADRAIHVIVTDVADSILTAKALHQAIVKEGAPDLIIMGKESIDYEGMQTMFRLAANLNYPVASNVFSLELKNQRILVESELGAGKIEKIEIDLPCVIAVSKGLNKPNYPTLPQIIQAKKKKIESIDINSLVSTIPESQMIIQDLAPISEHRKSIALEGDLAQKVEKLYTILKNEAKVI